MEGRLGVGPQNNSLHRTTDVAGELPRRWASTPIVDPYSARADKSRFKHSAFESNRTQVIEGF